MTNPIVGQHEECERLAPCRKWKKLIVASKAMADKIKASEVADGERKLLLESSDKPVAAKAAEQFK